LPREQGWIRLKNEVSGDMLFKNSIERALEDKIWDSSEDEESRCSKMTSWLCRKEERYDIGHNVYK